MHGFKIVREFYDAAVSGADPIDARAGFVDMLTYLRGNGAHTILVESASRFARDLAVQITGHELLRAEASSSSLSMHPTTSSTRRRPR